MERSCVPFTQFSPDPWYYLTKLSYNIESPFFKNVTLHVYLLMSDKYIFTKLRLLTPPSHSKTLTCCPVFPILIKGTPHTNSQPQIQDFSVSSLPSPTQIQTGNQSYTSWPKGPESTHLSHLPTQ